MLKRLYVRIWNLTPFLNELFTNIYIWCIFIINWNIIKRGNIYNKYNAKLKYIINFYFVFVVVFIPSRSILFWNSLNCVRLQAVKGINNRKLWISNRFLAKSNHFSCGYRESINYRNYSAQFSIDKSSTSIFSDLFYSMLKYSYRETNIIKLRLIQNFFFSFLINFYSIISTFLLFSFFNYVPISRKYRNSLLHIFFTDECIPFV